MLPLQSRREFTKLALAALPGAGLLSTLSRLGAAETPGRPNSKFAGVQIGINVPYSFSEPMMSGDEILKNCIELGLSGVELRAQPVEAFMGVPLELIAPPPRKDPKQDAAKGTTPKPTGPSKKDQLRDWRKGASLDKAKDFRAKYETAGVLIEIVKIDNLFSITSDELDYSFALAKALGARAISSEISHKEDELKRVGQFADKHQMLVGYHGHATTTPEHWEAAFALAKYNGANVDLGHFVAGNNTSPVPFIKKYHERVTHVHLKDRKYNNGPNTPFGEGDTPIAEVLRLIRDEKWPIQGTIEFEYKIPADSNRMAELARAIKFCKDALA
jgi:sugar phosphate isomerase/epimerase